MLWLEKDSKMYLSKKTLTQELKKCRNYNKNQANNVQNVKVFNFNWLGVNRHKKNIDSNWMTMII